MLLIICAVHSLIKAKCDLSSVNENFVLFILIQENFLFCVKVSSSPFRFPFPFLVGNIINNINQLWLYSCSPEKEVSG